MSLMNVEWKRWAACKEFPDTKNRKWWFLNNQREFPKEARALCASCPVLEQCERYVMVQEAGKKAHLRYGNFAGMTPSERARYARTGMKPETKTITPLKKAKSTDKYKARPQSQFGVSKPWAAATLTPMPERPPSDAHWTVVQGSPYCIYDDDGNSHVAEKWVATWKHDGKVVKFEELRRTS